MSLDSTILELFGVGLISGGGGEVIVTQSILEWSKAALADFAQCRNCLLTHFFYLFFIF